MSDFAIRVENLGKEYRIGGAQESYKTLRESLSGLAMGPVRALQSLAGRGSEKRGGDESFWALKDVSFEVKRGEVVGVIGRNGAGKSTLLKVLSRITEPTRGSIRIRGRVGSLLEVGTGFHPELSGRENIFLNGAILGMSRSVIEKRFDEIVDFAEVERFIDTPVKRYSSGMYLRLAFAVAAYLEPEVLVVDEVLAVGDAEFQKKCLGKMGDVAKEGRTVLLVSHNMGAIRGLCQTAVWMNQGTMMMRGAAVEVVDHYLSAVLDKDQSVVSLEDVPRAGEMGERLRILKIEFNSGGSILHGEPLTIRIDYQSKSFIHAAAFGVAFSSLDGSRLMCIDSDLRSVRHTVPANSCGSVEAIVGELHLQPGRYMIDVGARSGESNGIDYLPSCGQVEVLPGPNTPSFIIRDHEAGSIRLPGIWSWSEVNSYERR